MQSEFAKIGRVPAIRSEGATKSFGESFSVLQGKNVQAIFNTQLAPRPAPSPYESLAGKPASDAINRVFARQEDVNTALRKADEEANRSIEEKLH